MTASANTTDAAIAALPPIAFIGGGNMAASLVGGLLAGGLATGHIRVAQRSAARAEALRERFGVTVVAQAAEAIEGCSLIVLAVKPQQMQDALRGLTPVRGATVISVAAGLRAATLAHWLPDCHLVRAMPNTPSLFREGISGLFAPAGTPEASRRLAQTVMESAGAVCWLENETQIDAVTALSGCGPAYYFLLTEALREAGESLGLSRDMAAALAQQTFIGAAAMARGAGEDVTVLRQRVASKGGITETALASLESDGLRSIFRNALRAADTLSRQRADELESSLHA